MTDLNQSGGDVGVGDPAGDDKGLPHLHEQHGWTHVGAFNEWPPAV